MNIPEDAFARLVKGARGNDPWEMGADPQALRATRDKCWVNGHINNMREGNLQAARKLHS